MSEIKLLANNKKARHEYFIEEVYECGIELKGTEVKSIKKGKVSIKESYCMIENAEVFVYSMNVSPYTEGNIFNVDSLRKRKLLMHKSEIRKLIGKTKEQGYTLIPLRVYAKNGLVKVEIALAKGKNLYDKRETLKKRDDLRNMQRAMRR
ncbi:MAG: SsrA-binding protein SmpB [Finegoldia magna]|uniref:SsrA-binding protein SmpB n=1 Tax=Finegoldia magna TaxID=1260 RepID=UPI000763F735|nr:SsrA-binding protein SmpB [Finegoldia magna]KXA08970.1 SsrA-binding protein [Finegoldia magna]MBS6927303.1 SsrA-binding protein SmpB [Finegoldia magna]